MLKLFLSPHSKIEGAEEKKECVTNNLSSLSLLDSKTSFTKIKGVIIGESNRKEENDGDKQKIFSYKNNNKEI